MECKKCDETFCEECLDNQVNYWAWYFGGINRPDLPAPDKQDLTKNERYKWGLV